jgi:hypothetical protein
MRSPFLLCLAAIIPVLVSSESQNLTAADLHRRLDKKFPSGYGSSMSLESHSPMSKTAKSPSQPPTARKLPMAPANDETLYNVASLTKPVIAEVIDRLASEGKLPSMNPSPPTGSIPTSKTICAPSSSPRASASLTKPATWRYQTNNVLTFKSQPGTKVGYSSEDFNYVARFAE